MAEFCGGGGLDSKWKSEVGLRQAVCLSSCNNLVVVPEGPGGDLRLTLLEESCEGREIGELFGISWW